MKTKLKQFGYVFGIVISAAVLGTLLQFAKAWTEPASAPQTVNIGAPISTGNASQNKLGSIGSSGSISAAGAVQGSQLCIGADCKSAWPSSTGIITADFVGANAYENQFGTPRPICAGAFNLPSSGVSNTWTVASIQRFCEEKGYTFGIMRDAGSGLVTGCYVYINGSWTSTNAEGGVKSIRCIK